MKNYQVYFYFLFVLLITGAFASMAQNAYGMTLLGLVAISFSILFARQFYFGLKLGRPTTAQGAELISLIVLSGALALRIFNFNNKFVDLIIELTGAVLVMVYLSRILVLTFTPTINKGMVTLFLAFYFSLVVLLFAVINTQVIPSLVGPSLITAFGLLMVFFLGTFFFKFLQAKSKTIALAILYYLSLIAFILSLITTQFFPAYSEPSMIIGFCIALVFVIGTFFSKEFHLEGEKVTVVQFIIKSKDQSILVISLFLLFTLYSGFTRMGWLPKMYSSELPQVYYKLLNEAESGKELPVDGKFKHEEFKLKYNEFIKKLEESAD